MNYNPVCRWRSVDGKRSYEYFTAHLDWDLNALAFRTLWWLY